MKLKKNLLIHFILVVLIFSTSCKKNDTGGKAEIHALIFHGDTPIRSSTLYVKFNASQPVSDPEQTYDLKLQGEEDDNHVHVENMRPGDYYLYAVGFDSTAMKEVRGGIAASIKWTERKKLKEVKINVE
jgi:hypothetical protein